MILHTFKSSWWTTCSVLLPAIWNHRITSTTISRKHIFILIFYYSVGRIVSPKFSLVLSAANDGTLSKFKSHYSTTIFSFFSILFSLLFLYWKITIFNYIVKIAINQKCFAIFIVWGTSGLKQKSMLSTKSLLSQLKEKWLLAILTAFVLPRRVIVAIGEVWQIILHAVTIKIFI